ncbi:Eco57I restriction-modification methylase [Paenibacillus catalpae]|uniref:site-specific DNA-methyltransferase (adenine-specific) n=1 Tax=Paenibacillus catalpae TaxID=1045775 RepID=A0A1I1YPF4_9BACL|nr:Eco57I restriction-modification methylase domain-containing protein [Paenibacillus catalpae]SFE20023.1 Eco57I restriction-modification methylase [Paenibacillus catalpae]
MTKIKELEELRSKTQIAIDAQKNLVERNQMGQYSTPFELAKEVAEFVLNQWKTHNPNTPIRFLEPAIGTGAFYSAFRSQALDNDISNATGIELDKSFFEASRDLWKDERIKIINEDSTKVQLNDFYNLLITNPPYVRHHHIDKEEKDRLKKKVKELLGYDVSGLSGLYCYFIWLSHQWLLEGAWATWLIPSEYLDVNYGRLVKKYLKEKVRLKFIHKYDPNNCQFTDALVSSCVLIYEKSVPDESDVVRFSFGGSIEKPDFVKYVRINELNPDDKWSWNLMDRPEKTKTVQFSDFFDVKRGIATGNNDFFVLERKQIEEMGLPIQCFTPLLPPPRGLNSDVIECDIDGFPDVCPQPFVIDTSLTEEELADKYPQLSSYLDKGKQEGILEGYIVRNRKVWYKQENRKPAPFLCTYMGRESSGGNPFRFIWNKSNAIVTNGYLMLYPKGELKALLKSNPNLYSSVYDALCLIADENFSDEGREYGGGLKKIEPKELGKVSADALLSILPSYEVVEQQLIF